MCEECPAEKQVRQRIDEIIKHFGPELTCPEGHTELEIRGELEAPKGHLAYLCLKCLEIFYRQTTIMDIQL